MKLLIIADRPLEHPVAMEKGSKIARAVGAKILLAGFSFDPVIEKRASKDSKKQKNEMTAENQKRLKGQAKEVFGSSLEYDIESVWTDDIEKWVTEKTKGKDFDLIVKTGHRSESAFYTPLDWQLIRHATAPMLITSPTAWKEKPRILATIDVESNDTVQMETNSKVLQKAAGLSAALGGELHVATCKPVSKVLADLDLVQVRNVEDKNKDKNLQKAEKALSDLNISNATCHFRAGKVANAIQNIARKSKIDLTVIGSVGSKKLKGLILGSTAEEVLQRVKGDVLIIRPV